MTSLWKQAALACAFAVAVVGTGPASAQTLEKKHVVIGAGGRALFAYLPLNLAESLGYFKDEGLDVEIPDFAGGSKVTQSLVGGSADFGATALEQTIKLQPKGQLVKGVVALTNYSFYVLLLPKARAAAYKSPADLKGLKIGVTSPGSASNVFVDILLSKAGLKAQDVSIIGVGGGAGSIAALQRGDIDALASLEPVISQLESDGKFVAVADTRTAAGMKEIYGGAYIPAALLAMDDFIKKNPNTVQAVVNAQVRALRWLSKATPDQIMAALAPEYVGKDRAIYRAALVKCKEGFSSDGLISQEAAQNVYRVLTQFDTSVDPNVKIDLKATYDNSFAQRVPVK